jgi:ATP-dependent Clp protease ATP-binding subunit ClpA
MEAPSPWFQQALGDCLVHERFSDRARHSMALANLEAGKLKHSELRPAHLLLGLIAEGHCVATEALRLLNVDLDRVRQQVSARMEKGSGDGSFSRRAHTDELRAVIKLAIDEARTSNHRYVGTEHLILGLLAQSESVPAQVLREQGVDLEALRKKTLALLQATVDPAHDLAHSRHGHLEWIHQQELAKAFRSTTLWQTLILAVDAANRTGAGEIEGPHLLLALMGASTNGVKKLLAEKGVTEEWVRERLGSGIRD